MKIFISADIEGTAGVTDWSEANKGDPSYAEFRELMTEELIATCAGVTAAGAQEIWVKDAHQTGRNLILSRLPENVRIVRGWSGHPLTMMQELDDSFDAVLFTGYHAKAGVDGNPLGHTLTGKVQRLRINGELASEFTINAFAAAYFDVPIAFLSGDEGICADARALVPAIETLPVSQGKGPSTVSLTPQRAVAEIRRLTEAALSRDLSICRLSLPPSFELTVEFKSPSEAYRVSWYPGASLSSPRSVSFRADDYFEILRAIRFLVL